MLSLQVIGQSTNQLTVYLGNMLQDNHTPQTPCHRVPISGAMIITVIIVNV